MVRRVPSLPPPLSGWAWAADCALAVVLAVATLHYLLTSGSAPALVLPAAPPPPPLPGAPASPSLVETAVPAGLVVLALVTALPLAVRRRYPLSAFWLVAVASVLLNAHAHSSDTAIVTFASTVIAAYSAAMYSPYRAGTVISLVAVAALIGVRHETTLPNVNAGYLPILVLVAIGLTANTISTWKQRYATLQSEQEEATRLAVLRERVRIAGELHDVVTHNVAVMLVQAGAARKVIDTAPEQARDALLAVEAGGRAAMTELRHVVGLMTADDDGQPDASTDLGPQPGLSQVDVLTDRVRAAGVPIEVTVTGPPATLPPGVDLAAYRVVQEGLTNAMKHAAGARIRITIDYTPDAVHVEVSDTGGSPSGEADSGSGRGLMLLRERLAVYGGTLKAGPRPIGGFRVHATIPVAAL